MRSILRMSVEPFRRAALVAALTLAAAPALAGVDVHIGIPAPPSIVIEAPPHLVVVPGVPRVQYAPDLSYNYFAYGGQYYTYHENNWFVAPSYGGPWAYVDRVRVPRPVLGVPVRYYRHPPRHVVYRDYHHYHGHPHGMPPGQAKKYYRYDHDHGHHGHGHGHDDD